MGTDTHDLARLHEMAPQDLLKLSREYEIENATSLKRQELIFQILNASGSERLHIRRRGPRDSSGRLRVPKGARYNYLAGADDIYVSPSQIKRSASGP